jgi:hypothetical protein
MSGQTSGPAAPTPNVAGASSPCRLFDTAHGALGAIREDFHYWTGRLTDTSLQLSYAVIAANWAVFGSVERIGNEPLAKLSVACVVVSLGLNVLGTKAMSELLRVRVEYAEGNPERWTDEFRRAGGCTDPWPYTSRIERLGRGLRELKTWLPILAGVLFFLALLMP